MTVIASFQELNIPLYSSTAWTAETRPEKKFFVAVIHTIKETVDRK